MEIKICQVKLEWDSFYLKKENNEFLQSWNWGEFQRSVGHEPLRLQVIENEVVVWQGQGFVHRLLLGLKYLYVPRMWNVGCGMLDVIADFLKAQDFVFIRIEPINKLISNFSRSEQDPDSPSGQFPIFKSSNRQPRQTLILNLTQSAEQLLSQMHPKTRYNINLSEKKGVIVKQEKNADIFWQLNEETKSRDMFKSHDKNYYAKMLESSNIIQLVAYYNNQPIASNICVHFGDTFVYLHGASSNEMRNLMPPYLLQWRGIELAKKLNCKYYDFWGISSIVEEKEEKIKTCFNNFCWEATHPWTGVTRFKVGFGGKVREYGGAVEVVTKSMIYKFYQLGKRFL